MQPQDNVMDNIAISHATCITSKKGPGASMTLYRLPDAVCRPLTL